MITVEFARPLYDGSDPIHDFDHAQRALALARRIGQAEGADLEVVETAVLLHDIHRADEDQGHAAGAAEVGDHALLAADAARRILARQNPPPSADFIEAVAHCIAAHRFRNSVEPQTIEAKTVFDADKLDAIGAIGIARAYAYGGMMGQRLWGEVPDGYTGNGPDHTAYHEFVYKLSKIQDRLTTTTGRAIAQERHAAMVAYFERLRAEIEGRA